jgi:hypothetical protein
MLLGLTLTSVGLMGQSILLGGSLYDALVLGPNLLGGPDVLEHGRLFMVRATPANLFRRAAPATQVLLLLSLIAMWPHPRPRWLLAGALLCTVVADIITFTVHFPRNRLLFGSPTTTEPARLARAASEWAIGNWARVALVLGGWVLVLMALGAER